MYMSSTGAQSSFWLFLCVGKANSKATPSVALLCLVSTQVWLQEFGWTEETCASKMAQRDNISGIVQSSLKTEPMFCFGTAVKLMYWSHLVYDVNEEGSKRFSVDTALGLFGLDNFEMIWEKAEDTKVRGSAH